MGATLVAKALTKWGPIVSDKAFRVLMRMSLTALDTATEETPACLYFDHPDNVAKVMGGTGTLASQGRLARSGIEELIERGALERVNRAKTGSRQVYRLTLDNTPREIVSTVKPRVRPKHWRAPKGQSSDAPHPPGSDAAHPPGSDAPHPEVRMRRIHPRNQEEPPEELTKEYVADLGDPVHGNAPPTRPQNEDQPLGHSSTTDHIDHETPVVDLTAPPTTPTREQPRCPDPTCLMGYIKIPGQPGNHRCPDCNPPRDKPRWIP